MSNILEFIDIQKSYNGFLALNNINFSLNENRIVGLLGPNGSGKTTMMKLISGLIKPNKGRVLINGMEPSCETKKIVSYLPEKSYLNDWMKVNDLINFFADFYEDFDKNKANEMLSHLKISGTDRLKALSKGTKEKVQLILVMSRASRLYVLDEPIGGVDPAGRDYILRTILSNYAQNSTILISTHLISDVENIFDDILFLKDGEIILQGSVDEIREEKGQSIDNLFREVFKC